MAAGRSRLKGGGGMGQEAKWVPAVHASCSQALTPAHLVQLKHTKASGARRRRSWPQLHHTLWTRSAQLALSSRIASSVSSLKETTKASGAQRWRSWPSILGTRERLSVRGPLVLWILCSACAVEQKEWGGLCLPQHLPHARGTEREGAAGALDLVLGL